MTLPNRSVCLYIDGAQNPHQLERGIGRYVSEHALAIDTLAPSLLHSVLLNPSLSLTGNLSAFLGKGLLSRSSRSRASRASEVPLVYHIMSPFEAATAIETMWPGWARDPRIATVVTLYDLIPLIFPDQYLRDQALRAFHTGRRELIRHADRVLALSSQTAEDAVERLGVSPDRVHVIGAGTSEHFAGMYPSEAAAWAHLSRNLRSVRPGFLLYVGGADFRKNMEGLIDGYGRLPSALRAQHQLVIANILLGGQAESLRNQAEHAGVAAGELALTGHVSDFDLGALYRACSLFVFPSFYEGFGLPMLEAMSCGAPVVASATTTGPEVLGDLEGTFDPHDPDSIASCLAGVLGSPEVLERLRVRSRRRVGEFTWRGVAERSIEAYERAVAGATRHRCRRARIALVTPWPPERSWVGEYNLRLAGELGRRVDVDVVVRGPVESYRVSGERGVRLIDVREFEQLRDLRQHDRVVYCMGNSDFHGHVYEMLRRRPGVVVMYDVRLTGFYRWYAGVEDPGDPEGALEERIAAMYGDRLPAEAIPGLASDFERQVALGIYMTRELQGLAEQCFVHSRFAREVLELDRGPLDREVEVSVLPFALPDAGGVERGAAAPSPLIASLGRGQEMNGVATLIDAFALLMADMPAVRLVIARDAGGSGALERWHAYASEHAPGANIEFAGEVSAERYAELLRAADLAVQPETALGEMAVEVADCLASGVPTIVSDLGWANELPPGVAVKVPPGVAPQRLKDRMLGLLADDGERTAISRAALEHARASSFTKVADAYTHALALN